MKKTLVLLSTLLLLSACGTVEVRYRASFTTEEAGSRQELLLASMRLINQRLGVLGIKPDDQNIEQKDGIVTIVLKLPDGTVRQILRGTPDLTRLEQQAPQILDRTPQDLLTEQLTKPFGLRLMLEVPEAQADIVIPELGAFKETGITEKSLAVVQAAPSANDTGKILLVFTKDGEAQVGKLFRSNKGKTIGLFLRDRLVSKVVSTGQPNKNVIIDNVPSMQVANQFADEVNVGLYVTFAPVE